MASSATDAGNTEKAIRQELIATGDVEAIVSVGNNFFYTRSLPCHVWFFNKNKRDKKSILMIDARNTFRVVNQTINDFSEGQLLNLGAIMGSYRVADNSAILNTQMKYIERLEERFDELTVFTKVYVKALNPLGYADLKVNANSYRKMPSFTVDMHRAMEAFEKPVLNVDENIEKLEKQLKLMSTNIKAKKVKQKEIEKEQKKAKEDLAILKNAKLSYVKDTEELRKDTQQLIKDFEMLKEYFPEGSYQDIEGFCKVATLEDIKENDYSLTPGRYVGFSIELDEDFDYEGRMTEIHSELRKLHKEANVLMSEILS
jgi:type I restriction enzyme M protein